MNGRRCRMSAERERNQEQHFHSLRKVRVHVGRNPLESVRPQVSRNDPEVIRRSIRTELGSQTVRQINRRVEHERHEKNPSPQPRKGREALARNPPRLWIRRNGRNRRDSHHREHRSPRHLNRAQPEYRKTQQRGPANRPPAHRARFDKATPNRANNSRPSAHAVSAVNNAPSRVTETSLRRRACDRVADAIRYAQPVPVALGRPHRIERLVGPRNPVVYSAKTPDQDRDGDETAHPVSPESHEHRFPRASPYFPHQCEPESPPEPRAPPHRQGIGRPPPHGPPGAAIAAPMMMHHQHAPAIRMNNQRRARHMTRRELQAGKRLRTQPEQLKRKLMAFPREAIRGGIESLHNPDRGLDVHLGSLSSCCFVQTRSGSSCSDFVNASRACSV